MVRGQSNNAGHSRAAFSARDDGILAPKWSPVQSNVAKIAPEWKRILRPIDNRPLEDAMSRRYSRKIWAMVRQEPGTRFKAQDRSGGEEFHVYSPSNLAGRRRRRRRAGHRARFCTGRRQDRPDPADDRRAGIDRQA